MLRGPPGASRVPRKELGAGADVASLGFRLEVSRLSAGRLGGQNCL